MQQITATLVRKMEGWTGDARLYKLSRSVNYGYNFDTQKPEGTTDHVVVSAVVAPFSGPETIIFPANADGKVFEYLEMEGSLRDTLSHAEAIRHAGWVEAAPAEDETEDDIEDDLEDDTLELSDAAYLRDLSERLRDVPPRYGVDGYDIDRLARLGSAMEKEADV